MDLGSVVEGPSGSAFVEGGILAGAPSPGCPLVAGTEPRACHTNSIPRCEGTVVGSEGMVVGLGIPPVLARGCSLRLAAAARTRAEDVVGLSRQSL